MNSDVPRVKVASFGPGLSPFLTQESVCNQIFQITNFIYKLKSAYFSKKSSQMNITKHILSFWLYPWVSILILGSFIKVRLLKIIQKQCDEFFADFTLIVLNEVCPQRQTHTHTHTNKHTCTNTQIQGTASNSPFCDRTSPTVLSRLSNVLCILKLLIGASNCITNAEWLIHSCWPLVYKKPAKCLGE